MPNNVFLGKSTNVDAHVSSSIPLMVAGMVEEAVAAAGVLVAGDVDVVDDENEGGGTVVVLVVVLDDIELGGGAFNPPACDAWTTSIDVAAIRVRKTKRPFFIRLRVLVRVAVAGKNFMLDIIRLCYLPVVVSNSICLAFCCCCC